jgi:hypothetical protein
MRDPLSKQSEGKPQSEFANIETESSEGSFRHQVGELENPSHSLLATLTIDEDDTILHSFSGQANCFFKIKQIHPRKSVCLAFLYRFNESIRMNGLYQRIGPTRRADLWFR